MRLIHAAFNVAWKPLDTRAGMSRLADDFCVFPLREFFKKEKTEPFKISHNLFLSKELIRLMI